MCLHNKDCNSLMLFICCCIVKSFGAKDGPIRDRSPWFCPKEERFGLSITPIPGCAIAHLS